MANTRKLSLHPWGLSRIIDARDIEYVTIESSCWGYFLKIVLRDEMLLSETYTHKTALRKKMELESAWNQLSGRCE